MSRPRILSDAQIDEMAKLRERGWGLTRIAKHFTDAGFPISEGAIGWQCLRVGADAPKRLRGTRPCYYPPYMRGGHLVRRFTDAEDAQLLALESEGISNSEIGRRLGRPSNSIRARLLTLARADQRAEDNQPTGVLHG